MQRVAVVPPCHLPVAQADQRVVAVITVIEALRAFDIVFALNNPRGTEVMGTSGDHNLVGEGGGRVGRIRLRDGAVHPLRRLRRLVRRPTPSARRCTDGLLTADAGRRTVDGHAVPRAGRAASSDARALYVVLTVLALGWLVPIGGVYSSLRYFEADTQVNGVFSWPER